jgi:YVTN family beta-propeller protein
MLLDLGAGVPVAAIEVPGEPHSLVLSPDGRWVYVVQRQLNQLAVIDTVSRTIRTTIPLGQRPDMLAISPDGSTLYVTVRDEDRVDVVSTKDLTVTATVPTGRDPHGVAYRHTTGPATVASGGEMSWERGGPAGPMAPTAGQPRWMGQGMMGQGMCCRDMCMTPEAASMTGGPIEPWGLLRMMDDGQMDPKTRGQMLELRGEMLKAIGDVMMKHGQAMSREP